MMEEGRWQEAGRLLALLPDETFRFYPDLFFFKGLLYASLLLPEPVRPQLLGRSFVDFRREVQEGDMARQHREAALAAFSEGKKLLLALGANERVRHFDYHMMWLKLTDFTEKNAAFDELREVMKDGEKAALMLDIAVNFEVEFDQAPVERYLRRRKREGREQPYDHGARLLLLHYFGTPRDLLDHLAKEEATLQGVLQPSSLALMKIDALIRDEKVADAATELEKIREAVSAEVFERLRLLIADHKGEDINRLEELYSRTKDYQDLSNLVRYLERTQQPTSLLPYAQQLFATQRTAYNLLRVVRAMTETGIPDDQIVACLDEQSDLLDPRTVEGNELLLHRARAFSGTGQLGAAQKIAKEVAERTHEPSAVSLEISLALRAGTWEHFTAIVDREFPRRAELPAALLMQMASVLTDWDPDRALELAGIAAEGEAENGEIQTFAYWLATQIGRDLDGRTWLQRAIALARVGKGPLQQTTLRELVDSIQSNSARRREWERQYFEGKIGVYQAAVHLNMPVAALLVGELIHNELQVDPRQRSVVPVRHGGRGAVDLSGVHRVAFDLSSLLVLEYLGILGIVFEALDEVDISQRLMDVLFVERRRVRFHQPSLVDRAERFLSLLDEGLLQVAESSDPPPSLVGEIGYDLANLLHLARREGGRVLSVLPLTTVGSLGEEEAELGEFGAVILKTTQYLEHIRAHLPPETYGDAKTHLSSVDVGEALGEDDLGDGPLYAQELALDYLYTTGTLGHLRRLNRDVFVEASLKTEARALVRTAKHGEQILDVMDRVRKRLRDGIETGKVRFLQKTGTEETREWLLGVTAFADMVAAADNTDAVCVDDRWIGKHPRATGQQGGTVPLICTADILQHLVERELISATRKRTYEIRLGQGGFAFLPLHAEMVIESLKEAVAASPKRFAENADLIAVRESILRIRSLRVLQIPEELDWLAQMNDATQRILDYIWGDSAIEIPVAQQISDWVFDVLTPLPTTWQASVVKNKVEDFAEAMKVVILFLVHRGVAIPAKERALAFGEWVEDRVVAPLLPANAELVDSISQTTGSFVVELVKDLPGDAIEPTTGAVLARLPMSITERLLEDSRFLQLVGVDRLAMKFTDAGRVKISDLLDATRKAYGTGRAQTIRNLDGDEVLVALKDGRAAIVQVGEDECEHTLFELGLLSPDVDVRLQSLGEIRDRFGVTGPAVEDWGPVVKSRQPSDAEVSQVRDGIIRSVANWEAVTRQKISRRELTPSDLVPGYSDYFTALCGPLPTGVDVDQYIRGPLKDHRGTLIARDIPGGVSLLLPGSLHADVSIVPVLSALSDEAVWTAVEPLASASDPFTIVGLIEIALARRSGRPEFEDLAERLIVRLCGERLVRQDGKDIYDFFPVLVETSIHHLRRNDGMMLQPPYWHKLCAFTHAGLLCRLLDGFEFDPAQMSVWLKSAMQLSDATADILALRGEPSWRFDHLTSQGIQAEILGRLKLLQHNEESKGRSFPNAEVFEQRIDEVAKRGLSPCQPGPLEGYLRPSSYGKERLVPEATLTVYLAKIGNPSNEFPWMAVDELSRSYSWPNEFRDKLAEWLSRVQLSGTTFAERVNSLGIAGFIASTHRDRAMAERIAERLFREFEKEDDTEAAFMILLIASTAIHDDDWIEWFSEKLCRLATVAPRGKSTRRLGALVDGLEALLPVSRWRFGQVKALCGL